MIQHSHTVHPISAVRTEWSLWSQDIEEEIIPVCRELGIGIVPYGPIGHGFLAGKGVAESLPQDSYPVQPSSRTWMTMLSLLKVKLTSKDLKEISDAVPRDEVVGHTTYASVASFSWKHANTPPRHGSLSA
ncbi:unnamed protein product [Musa hybrid cultivar]